MRDVLTAAIAICGLAGASACTPAPPPPPPPPPAAPQGAAALATDTYRIQAGDVLGIRLLLNPDLNEDVVVRPDGHISTMVVREEQAAGRTVPELVEALTNDYISIIRQPRLNVELQTFTTTPVYVGGDVARPGVSVTAGLAPTLSQAILRAGGLRSGHGSRVFIIRRGSGDKPQIFSSRLQDVMQAHEPEADVRLEPYDAVYVPHDGVAEVHRFLKERLAQLVPQIWSFSYDVSAVPAP
jgi:polysaccharide export outer membrane protein